LFGSGNCQPCTKLTDGSDTCKLARLKPDANPLLADALLSVWVVLLNLKGFTMNLGDGKKKINKSRGGKNS
jgi:hypothetical protein